MARLLENQAKELLRESTSMSSGDVEGFAAVAFPIVRRVFAGLIANDLVSVQPMSLPSGLIFFLDFTFSGDLGEGAMDRRFGNVADKSIYGTDQVGSEVINGVDLVDSRAGDLSGPRSSARGYSYASPSGSAVVTSSATNFAAEAWEIGAETPTQLRSIQYDPDILALSGSGKYVVRIAIPKNGATFTTAGQWANLDYNNLSAIDLHTLTDLNGLTDGVAFTTSNVSRVRRLTQLSGTTHINMFFVTDEDASGLSAGTGDSATGSLEFPIVDAFQAGANTDLGAVRGATPWGLEGNADIPEIDIKVDSIAVTAQTKKLKAKWTPELGQDLNAYHNLDAEVELTSLLSEQIALEIDREILADLVNGATAATRYWSRAPGLFVDSNGNEIGAAPRLLTSLVPSVSGTRPSLRPSTMSLLRSTVRLFVVVLTSSSADPRLPTSLSSPLASVQASLTPTRRAPSALSRSVHSARSLMSSLTPTSYATSS
jgi:hypothetical protein